MYVRVDRQHPETNTEARRVQDAMFAALLQILRIDSLPCQRAALHGLGHLRPPPKHLRPYRAAGGAEKALQYGLVNEVVPRAKLKDRAQEITQRLVSKNRTKAGRPPWAGERLGRICSRQSQLASVRSLRSCEHGSGQCLRTQQRYLWPTAWCRKYLWRAFPRHPFPSTWRFEVLPLSFARHPALLQNYQQGDRMGSSIPNFCSATDS